MGSYAAAVAALEKAAPKPAPLPKSKSGRSLFGSTAAGARDCAIARAAASHRPRAPFALLFSDLAPTDAQPRAEA